MTNSFARHTFKYSSPFGARVVIAAIGTLIFLGMTFAVLEDSSRGSGDIFGHCFGVLFGLGMVAFGLLAYRGSHTIELHKGMVVVPQIRMFSVGPPVEIDTAMIDEVFESGRGNGRLLVVRYSGFEARIARAWMAEADYAALKSSLVDKLGSTSGRVEAETLPPGDPRLSEAWRIGEQYVFDLSKTVDVTEQMLLDRPTDWHGKTIRVTATWANHFEGSHIARAWVEPMHESLRIGLGIHRVCATGLWIFPRVPSASMGELPGFGHMSMSWGEFRVYVLSLESRP